VIGSAASAWTGPFLTWRRHRCRSFPMGLSSQSLDLSARADLWHQSEAAWPCRPKKDVARRVMSHPQRCLVGEGRKEVVATTLWSAQRSNSNGVIEEKGKNNL